MTPENRRMLFIRDIPGWAQRERQADFVWIQENLTRMFFIRVFWTVTTTALKDAGRGAIVVDTTLEPVLRSFTQP